MNGLELPKASTMDSPAPASFALHLPYSSKQPNVSLSNDLSMTGNKIYCDAAWKPWRSSSSPPAGLGIYLRLPLQDQVTDVFIQAVASRVSSPLMAEALALLLAGKLVQILNIAEPIFFTDSLILARAVAETSTESSLVHWEIRHHILQFQEFVAPLRHRIFHISRDLNGVAHNCAHQAKRS